ncbi:MAG: hypothetical protein EOO50_16255 [Flavobacterium sp.]|uniref:HesA/MoeB/ThiF family protein n=1 Tax=Flavobacterium sp. TaxID=239 RepID=UPI00121F8CC6|nr:HesA/MoeB/ThiF family protein [Flavobacterium sp.]RZJ64274.1 MAG: hypothetical protein EOO50_16255 [Flavobacterium sp.]
MNTQNPRYARHYSLKSFGLEAQRELDKASVLVIGAGGLGCPVLQYLVAAGVGKIGIVDGDKVALSNLQRQVLFETLDVGKPKASTSAEKLRKLNPEIKIESFDENITVSNAFDLLSDYEIAIDCTDNFASRYLINDVCVLLKKPLVFGAIFQFEGQVVVFNSNETAANYRDLFPIPPDASEVLDCNEAGVLGVLPGTIGTLQAVETIKLICSLDGLLTNKLLTMNLLTYESFVIEISPDESNQKSRPKNRSDFENMNYDWFCGSGLPNLIELEPSEFLEKTSESDTLIIDVREPSETPKAEFANTNIPLSRLSQNISEIAETEIVLFCQSGKRSLKAAKILQQNFGATKKISHLKGGMIALNEHQNG